MQNTVVDCSFFFDEQLATFDDFLRTPSPLGEQQSQDAFAPDRVFVITPEQQQRKRADPTDVEQLLEHEKALKKLISTMQKSDETRTILKRQRLPAARSSNFFTSSECKELEKCRKMLFKILKQEVAKCETLTL